MNFYETIFILDAAPDAIDAEIKKVEDLITAHKGEVVSADRWGMRKLAYEIKRKGQGFYTCIYFKGDNGLPAILENQYKLNENCLRYLTVVSIHTPEEIQARAKKAAAETPAAAVQKAGTPAAAAIPTAAAAVPAAEGPEETSSQEEEAAEEATATESPREEEPPEPEVTEAVEEQAPEAEKPAEPLAEESAETATPEPQEEPAVAEKTEEIPEVEVEEEEEEKKE
jgi:small subunit ribosomal protein S6